MHPIYLDHNATTPMDPDVLEAMRPHFLAGGNAESRHLFGRSARRGWEHAKETVARILGAEPSEVIFTSGGTESNNLAVFGLAGAEASPGHVVTGPIEHPAIVEPVARLEAAGFAVDRVPVDAEGLADAAAMAATFRDDTRFATLMLANNETGAIQPVGELAALAADRGIPVHTDAVQAVGRIPVDFHALGVSTLAASAHKFHGPVGVGILLVQSGVRLGSRLFGGGQQQGRRPGTVAVPLAVGFAAALEKWHDESEARAARWTALRDRLEAGLIAALGPERVLRNGPTRRRSPAPADAERRLPRPGRRCALDAARPGRDRRLARLGVRQRLDPPLADPHGHARPRRPPAVLGALQPRRHDDRGRDRRGRPADRARSSAGSPRPGMRAGSRHDPGPSDSVPAVV